MGERPSLDIIIVTWNAGRYLAQCLQALERSLGRFPLPLQRVVVVDNASSDDSLSCLSSCHLPITLIRNPVNRGFSVASNQGAVGSRSQMLLFLNPDAQVQDDTLSVALDYISDPQHARVGVCGVQQLGAKDQVMRTCARLPTARTFIAGSLGLDVVLPTLFPGLIMSEWDHLTTRGVDHVMGAFYLIRTTLFTQVGGFDERFFLYLEDLDLSLRVARAGYSVVHLGTARVLHPGGCLSGKVKTRRLFYDMCSHLLYARKHFSPAAAFLVTIVMLICEPVARVVWALARLHPAEALSTCGACAMLWWRLPELLAARRR